MPVVTELNGIGSPYVLAKSVYGRAQIKNDLAKHGFKAPWDGCTIYILKRLTTDRYDQVMKLLEVIRAYCDTNLQLNEPLPLRLPWSGVLNTIRLDKLMANGQAMAEIIDRCIKLTGVTKPEVNLDSLPFIYGQYVAEKPQFPGPAGSR